MNLLPTGRDLNATLLMAPGVRPSGPGGNFSINGSVSFENLFLVNGVTVNENLRGTAPDLYIEDAVQETTVATAGISAEFGRFTGGVVNVITKSGGNDFSGSFRDTLNNDNWRRMTPFEETADRRPGRRRSPHRQGGADLRVHVRRPGDAGSPVVLRRRPPAEAGERPQHRHHQHPVQLHPGQQALRVQGHLRARLEPPLLRRLHQELPDARRTTRSTRTCRWTWRASARASCPRISSRSTTRAS